MTFGQDRKVTRISDRAESPGQIPRAEIPASHSYDLYPSENEHSPVKLAKISGETL